MIRLQCNCGQRVRVTPESLGELTACPHCRRGIRVVGPQPPDEAEKPPAFAARLVIQRGPERHGEQIIFPDHATVVIGRSALVPVILLGEKVSRQHCQLIPDRGTWILKDSGSRNGVHHNGQKVSEVTLAHGDMVGVGDYDLRFLAEPAKPLPAKAPTTAFPPEPTPPPPPASEHSAPDAEASASVAEAAAPPASESADPAQPPVLSHYLQLQDPSVAEPETIQQADAGPPGTDAAPTDGGSVLDRLSAARKVSVPQEPSASGPPAAASDHAADPTSAAPGREQTDAPLTPAPPGKQRCPSCERLLDDSVQICIDCGIKLPSGRPLLTSQGLDVEAIKQRSEAIFRGVSWFSPFGLMPVASEAYGKHRPIANYSIAILTILITCWYWGFAYSDGSQARIKHLMQWPISPQPSAEHIRLLYVAAPYGDTDALEQQMLDIAREVQHVPPPAPEPPDNPPPPTVQPEPTATAPSEQPESSDEDDEMDQMLKNIFAKPPPEPSEDDPNPDGESDTEDPSEPNQSTPQNGPDSGPNSQTPPPPRQNPPTSVDRWAEGAVCRTT